ncbi:hypothetical protein [Hyphomicrobium sp.]|jgi:hypothetical protein|uniref:hypothetical protein n=1 Tax=Hyphomicrobium sp. TaxID=82 RepID=UPI002D044D6E|nr:hypothetical protein [Hyphomicrobium sp.]HVZ04689.1 hypothetical protein [Hyphomicrobium sp.]
MEPTFGHPLWISSGILLLIFGGLLFRWARRDNAGERIAIATRESAVNKLFKGGDTPRAAAQPLGRHYFRRAMAQFFGIAGFLLIIAGLMATVLGIFYVGG